MFIRASQVNGSKDKTLNQQSESVHPRSTRSNAGLTDLRIRPVIQKKHQTYIENSRQGNKLTSIQSMLDQATKTVSPLNNGSYFNPIQCKATPPKFTNKVQSIADEQVAYSDLSVAIGPENQTQYTALIGANQPSRSAAIASTREEFTSIGQETTKEQGFLSEARLTKLSPNNSHVQQATEQAAVTYSALHEAQPLALNPTKATRLEQVKPYLQNPAVIETLRFRDNITQLIDPFRVYIRVPYTENGAVQELSSRVEFNEGQKGYITKVEDTGKGVSATLADRPNLLGEFPDRDPTEEFKNTGKTIGEMVAMSKRVGASKGKVGTFSNIHHVSDTHTVGEQINNIDQTGERHISEGGIDAYTKLIAEGGRWDCVASLGTQLSDESLFFTTDGADGFYAVDFETLWGKWKAFGLRYGIPDADVKSKINGTDSGGNIPGWVKRLRFMPTGLRHYNLDTGGRGEAIPHLPFRYKREGMTLKEEERAAIDIALYRNTKW